MKFVSLNSFSQGLSLSAAVVQKARGTKVGHQLYLKLEAYEKTVLQRETLCGLADFILSRHFAPTKNGFTDAAIKQVLLFFSCSLLAQSP